MSQQEERKEGYVSAKELPMLFQAKHLGKEPCRGLWGVKHTRRPVDYMVQCAKQLPADSALPMVEIRVSEDGLSYAVLPTTKRDKKGKETFFPVDVISYGVQDLVYTRVFSMIIVKDTNNGLTQPGQPPFECHAFVCDSRIAARKLTYALAAAFQEYSKRSKNDRKDGEIVQKKFAIDLRTVEEMARDIDLEDETEA